MKINLKVHCHAIQWFYVDFFAVENGGEETRGRGAGQREAGLCHTFFLHQFRASRSIDVGVSVSYPCKVIPLLDEDGLWDEVTLAKSFLSCSPTAKLRIRPFSKGCRESGTNLIFLHRWGGKVDSRRFAMVVWDERCPFSCFRHFFGFGLS